MLSNYNIQKAISNIVIVINDLKYVYFVMLQCINESKSSDNEPLQTVP